MQVVVTQGNCQIRRNLQLGVGFHVHRQGAATQLQINVQRRPTNLPRQRALALLATGPAAIDPGIGAVDTNVGLQLLQTDGQVTTGHQPVT